MYSLGYISHGIPSVSSTVYACAYIALGRKHEGGKGRSINKIKSR